MFAVFMQTGFNISHFYTNNLLMTCEVKKYFSLFHYKIKKIKIELGENIVSYDEMICLNVILQNGTENLIHVYLIL